ncbi:hypothetical protein LENED_004364 [Lentinula edodes]|uniref:Uncharacterized protein n=1 Tax=Lentinula edodes TaxID=5353 RepID=A0A1Q3E602_LENED|nr:hypothetical protein LENED_004364 [Lentinula edodes]
MRQINSPSPVAGSGAFSIQPKLSLYRVRTCAQDCVVPSFDEECTYPLLPLEQRGIHTDYFLLPLTSDLSTPSAVLYKVVGVLSSCLHVRRYQVVFISAQQGSLALDKLTSQKLLRRRGSAS